jgi:hypothetical protein
VPSFAAIVKNYRPGLVPCSFQFTLSFPEHKTASRMYHRVSQKYCIKIGPQISPHSALDARQRIRLNFSLPCPKQYGANLYAKMGCGLFSREPQKFFQCYFSNPLVFPDFSFDENGP